MIWPIRKIGPDLKFSQSPVCVASNIGEEKTVLLQKITVFYNFQMFSAAGQLKHNVAILYIYKEGRIRLLKVLFLLCCRMLWLVKFSEDLVKRSIW